MASVADAALAERVSHKPSDIATTRVYLIAKHRLEKTGSVAASEKAVRDLVTQVAGQCPGALAAAPENKAVEGIRYEAFMEVGLTLSLPQRGAVIAFAKRVERLHWSNRKLTYFAHGAADEERARAEINLPNLCSDAKALAADGFQTEPSTTTRLRHQVETAGEKINIVVRPPEHPPGSLEEKITKLLMPYERPDEKALIPHLPNKHQKEQAETYAIKLLLAPALEIVHMLGLHTEGVKPSLQPPAGAPA